MAGYFQLLNKKTGKPESFSFIDEELCNYFHEPIDPDKYLAGWYDSIGFRVAMGKSLTEIRQDFINLMIEDPKHAEGISNLIKILDWIDQHYTTNSWHAK